jgi:hypothetical protein
VKCWRTVGSLLVQSVCLVFWCHCNLDVCWLGSRFHDIAANEGNLVYRTFWCDFVCVHPTFRSKTSLSEDLAHLPLFCASNLSTNSSIATYSFSFFFRKDVICAPHTQSFNVCYIRGLRPQTTNVVLLEFFCQLFVCCYTDIMLCCLLKA